MLREKLGWDIEAEYCTKQTERSAFLYGSICLPDAVPMVGLKKCCFLLAPEYIGYADAGLEEDLFAPSVRPNIRTAAGRPV